MPRRRTAARTSWLVPSMVTALIFLAGLGLAEPILHEYFDFDGPVPSESRQTASQVAPSEPVEAAADAPAVQQDAQRGASEQDDAYRLDANTTRPDQVGYEDPFTPSIPPFKRVHAYDAVDAGFQLVVAKPAPTPLPTGGRPSPDRDQFFGDIELSGAAGTQERVPSVGGGAILLAAELEPATAFRLWRDGADNWFVERDQGGPARLRLHLAIDRDFFGATLADPEWRDLEKNLPSLPANVRRRGLEVADQLGVNRGDRPRVALTRLIAHFRSFSPSEELPRASDAGALYREIALSRKGVCRHRSYAFTVTALALGIPTRFVRNEAHAWVEIDDGNGWQRVDLGGAAGEMQLASAVDVAHVPPRDPFEWPAGSESAAEMTGTALRDAADADATSGGSSRAPGSEPNDTESDEASRVPVPSSGAAQVPAVPSVDAPTPPEPSDELDPAFGAPQVELEDHEDVVLQGGRIQLAGRVVGPSGPCPLLRVDIVLRGEGRTFPVGSLVTDATGAYSGAISLPYSVPVGDYELEALPHGATGCRATP